MTTIGGISTFISRPGPIFWTEKGPSSMCGSEEEAPDQGRIRRQQIFVREFLKRLKNPALLWRLPTYTQTLLAGFHTNLSTWDMAALLLEAAGWLEEHAPDVPAGEPVGMLWKMNPGEHSENCGADVVLRRRSGGHGVACVRSGVAGPGHRGDLDASDRAQSAKSVMAFLPGKASMW